MRHSGPGRLRFVGVFTCLTFGAVTPLAPRSLEALEQQGFQELENSLEFHQLWDAINNNASLAETWDFWTVFDVLEFRVPLCCGLKASAIVSVEFENSGSSNSIPTTTNPVTDKRAIKDGIATTACLPHQQRGHLSTHQHLKPPPEGDRRVLPWTTTLIPSP